ncbi:MAG: Sodium:alanine symporter [candidate division TM6 bacterium GW2011_GWF2_32_72]|nr:MAG: Sodium:alanine symporter [candidate division TM6 bacterium GW2011_GWF2_32_72]
MNILNNLDALVVNFSNLIWWPWGVCFVLCIGILLTFVLGFVQVRYFFESCKFVLFPPKSTGAVKGELSSVQAFINVLGAATGNGSIAGTAMAIAVGGPGAAFWIFVSGFLGMAIRFAETFLGADVIGKTSFRGMNGGPMVYLNMVPGKSFLPYIFAVFVLLYGFFSGNAMQANSIGASLFRVFGISPWIVAIVLTAFIFYVMIGGSKRILEVSDKLVPFKVGVFLISTAIVLIYNYASLWDAIILVFKGAFTPSAVTGAAVGLSISSAMQAAFTRSIISHESGLGISALLFGSTGSTNPVKDGIMSMLTTFISSILIGSMVSLAIISSGVWNSGLTGIDLTSAAFDTTFGFLGSWLVLFSAVSFGIGVTVNYAYIAKENWLFLTNGRFGFAFILIFAALTFTGTIAKIGLVWGAIDIVTLGMVLVNLYAVVYFLPTIRKKLSKYSQL